MAQPHGTKNRNLTLVALAVIAVVAMFVVGYLLKHRRGSTGTSGPEITTASGLKYVDLVVGSGVSPQKGQTVTVNYSGTLEDGTKVDSSFDRGRPANFRIGVAAVIPGWDEGVMSMKVGGKRKLFIPSELGYGLMGKKPRVPPNANLIFEIELLGVQ